MDAIFFAFSSPVTTQTGAQQSRHGSTY